jgi:hypothetical protein
MMFFCCFVVLIINYLNTVFILVFMINIPYNEIVKIIVEQSGLSETDVTSKINDKLNQLSGLISKEGAAHIIANELGVKVEPVERENETVKIKNVIANMRSVNLFGKVQRKYEIREFNSARGPGKVASLLLGDETGVLRIVFWNDQIDTFEKINENDIIKLENGYSRDNNGRKEIHLNSASNITINPDGVNIGEVKNVSEAPRKKISDLNSNDSNVEILGTIVQVFDIRFFEVCPECNKRIREGPNGFSCDNHGDVQPSYSYVFNMFLDDGSSNIRVVCFKNQLENLLQKTQDEIVKYKDSPQEFEQVKHDLLGHIVKIQGRVVNNDMFNRLEIISNMVFVDPNPEDEIKRLKKQGAVSESNESKKVDSVKKESEKESVGSLDDIDSIDDIETDDLSSDDDSDDSELNNSQKVNPTIPEDMETLDITDDSNQEDSSNVDLSDDDVVSLDDNSDNSESNEESDKAKKMDDLDSLESLESDLGNLDDDFFGDDELKN